MLQVAPITAAHMIKVARLGGFNTCSFFRVDKGFVAQVLDVAPQNRLVALNEQQLVRSQLFSTGLTGQPQLVA